MKKTHYLLRCLPLFIAQLLAVSVSAQVATQPYVNNWYVGNTSPGEWIMYKKVWLSAGDYRFTTQAVGATSGQYVHLELNGEVLQSSVLVPTNENNAFLKVHF